MNQSYVKILVPVLAIGIAIAFAVSFLHNQPPQPTPPAAPATATHTPPAPTTAAASAPAPAAEQPTPARATQAAASAPATQTANVPTTQPAAASFHVEQVDQQELAEIGSDQKGSPYKIKVQFTPWGSGIRQITLADYKTEAMGDKPYVLLLPMQAGQYTLFPYAARSVVIDGGTPVDLQNVPWRLVPSAKQDSVTYRLRVLDSLDKPVIEITRVFSLDKNSYDLRCDQQLANLTDRSLRVIWEQNAQGDVPLDAGGYDVRNLVAGYFNLTYNPTRSHIYTEQAYLPRPTVLNNLADKQTPFWPNPSLAGTSTELAWFATTNRYFAAVTHPAVQPPAAPGGAEAVDPWFNPQTGRFASLGTLIIGERNSTPTLDTRRLVFVLTSEPLTLPPAKAVGLNMGLYVGPLDDEAFGQAPWSALDFSKLIVYSRSCSFCMFQPVARGLLWLLKGIHFVVRDWGVAIIILVLLVRLALHPITKKSQISMTKMGKQMQTLQPEIEKLKKKYKDDQATLNSETMKLYREKGVNPANMLGCLPMALQMPIWVALYAMLYGAIELRHQPAFYGIFQAISGGHWAFLADLSAPDNFIRFAGLHFVLPILNKPITIEGIYLLPILMAIVYYIQQQLMAVPPANEQAAQQQKMMKWMILLFPIMLYAYPSGLNLYILASTAGGIVDSLIVRRHIKREEEAGTLFPPAGAKKNKPGGWRERLQESLESKQQAIQEKQRRDAQNRNRDK